VQLSDIQYAQGALQATAPYRGRANHQLSWWL